MTLPPVTPADIPEVDNLTIIDVMNDRNFFYHWFDKPSWRPWRVCLKVAFGLPLETEWEEDLYRRCTARTSVSILAVLELWVLAGRRSGKSIIAALCAVYLAVFVDFSQFLQPGEMATVPIIASDRRQARTVMRYVRSFLGVPLLKPLVKRETQFEIELQLPTGVNVTIEVQTGSYKSVRSYTCVSAVLDEVAFWKSEDGSPNVDKEIVGALRPSMSTIPSAMIIAISSPYARRGLVYSTFQKYYGKNDSSVMVWRSPSRVMNPLLSQAVIDRAHEEDHVSALAEWDAEFRSDLETFVSPETVDGCTVPGRTELPPSRKLVYFGFTDPSSGSGGDSFCLAISHYDRGKAVLDKLCEVRPPFSPPDVIEEYAGILKLYRVTQVMGDRWGGSWVGAAYEERGIRYLPSPRTKSELYLELAPQLNSASVELLDNARLRGQLLGLERRTGKVGRDSVDHQPGANDDIINSVAGSLVIASEQKAGECFGGIF